MRISKKLILLITLSVAMILFQFVVNRFMNFRMRAYTKSMFQLNQVDESMFAAITDEKNFIDTHKKAAFENTLAYIEKAQQTITALGGNSLVDKADLTVLDDLVLKYRNAVNHLGEAVNNLDGYGNQLNEAISRFNDKAAALIRKISEDIGTKVVNTEPVSEHLRSLMDITRQATFLMSQMFLIFNQDLLLKNDMDAYVQRSGKTFTDLDKEKKNAVAVAGFIKNKEYPDFVSDVMVATISKIPEWTAGIRESWREANNTQGDLDEIRAQLSKIKGQMVLACNGRMAGFERLMFWTNILTLVFSICTVSVLGVLILRSITPPDRADSRVGRADSRR